MTKRHSGYSSNLNPTKNNDIRAKRCLRTEWQWQTTCRNWDIRLSGSQGRWDLLLWLASVTTVAAWHPHFTSEFMFSKTMPQHLGHAMFSDTNISQGSVATPLRCSGVCNNHSLAHFLSSVTVKEFWKLANIWWGYGQEFVVFFDSRCIPETKRKIGLLSNAHCDHSVHWVRQQSMSFLNCTISVFVALFL